MPIINAPRIPTVKYIEKTFARKAEYINSRFESFVTGPAIKNASTAPLLIPSSANCCTTGMAAPPQT